MCVHVAEPLHPDIWSSDLDVAVKVFFLGEIGIESSGVQVKQINLHNVGRSHPVG